MNNSILSFGSKVGILKFNTKDLNDFEKEQSHTPHSLFSLPPPSPQLALQVSSSCGFS